MASPLVNEQSRPQRRRRPILILAILLAIVLALGVVFVVSDRERHDLSAGVPAGQPGSTVALSLGNVYYTWTGPSDGPVLVLVNPFSDPAYIWERNLDVLTGLGYRVLCYDLYGRGFTDRPRVAYTLDLFVDQLHELLGALAVRGPVRLAGLSMGGEIAAAFTARNPDMVDRLCLIDPEVIDVTWKTAFPINLPGVGEYLMAVYVIPFVLSSPVGDFYHPESLPGWGDRYRLQTTYRGFRRALLSTLRHLPADPMAAYRPLGGLGTPVLLVWGEKDTTIPISSAARIRAAVPQTEFHSIPLAGHLSNYERPDLVNPLLAAFFVRH